MVEGGGCKGRADEPCMQGGMGKLPVLRTLATAHTPLAGLGHAVSYYN